MSSWIADGERWFEMLKMRRLDQVIRRVAGRRERIVRGKAWGVLVRRAPEREEDRAKRVVGRAKVRKSEAVKR